jgi:predicted dehydrogenase
MTSQRVLIVGFGSIGERHARLLSELKCDVAVVSMREVSFSKRFNTLQQGLLVHQPTLVVVANATASHYSTLCELAQIGYFGDVLIEKPLFDFAKQLPSHNFRQLRVAYNLRFHPVVVSLHALLAEQSVISIQAYVGQYLPTWRPRIDYRLCYSAHADQGGGALLDLSHDLDYISWLVGRWRRVAAIGGHKSKLEITSDDVFSLLYESDRCPVIGVQLNYLDRIGRRRIIVNTVDHTYEADLFNNTLRSDGEEQHFPIERDTTYRAMHVAMLSGEPAQTSTVHEALYTLTLCDSARDAAVSGHWIQR